VILGKIDGAVSAAGLVSALCALTTVFTTGMIYASLKPVAQWHSRYTVPAYLIFAIMTGAVLLNAILRLFGNNLPGIAILAAIAIVAGWGWKIATWHYNDKLVPGSTANSATGLKNGTIRSIEWPHTEENYVLKEMGFRIARLRHSPHRRLSVALCRSRPRHRRRPHRGSCADSGNAGGTLAFLRRGQARRDALLRPLTRRETGSAATGLPPGRRNLSRSKATVVTRAGLHPRHADH
jgi:hypothetical protein